MRHHQALADFPAATWVAIAAMVFTGIAALAAWRQTRLQRRIHEASTAPYIWADLRPDDQQHQTLLLVVGNSGPSVARDVNVTIEPYIHGDKTTPPDVSAEAIQKRLATTGIASMPPGRVMSWNLGTSWDVIRDNGDQDHRVIVTGKGSAGRSLPTLEYVIRADDIRESRGTPPGTLHGIALAVRHLEQALLDGRAPRRGPIDETLGSDFARERPPEPLDPQ